MGGQWLSTMKIKYLISKGDLRNMRKQDYEIIMEYYNAKKMDRTALEATMDFENLTMHEDVAKDISKLLVKAGYKKTEKERAIKNFVHFVKERSGSGEITWDEFVTKLKELCLEDSEFGIRVQRFSKYSYWEVWFNHFNITEHEDNEAELTFDQDYYEDTERDNAYDVLWKNGIDTEMEESKIILQIAEKWNDVSKEERESLISALNAIYVTQYVDKSRMNISKNMIEKITITNADLVPEVGLRDYHITFTGGDSIALRF